MRKYISGICGLIAAGSLFGGECDNESSELKKLEKVSIYCPYNESNTTRESGIGVVAGDIDKDGLSDFVIATPSSVKYFRAITNGKFEEKQVICVPYDEPNTNRRSGIGVSLSDMNNDGTLDLVVATPSNVSIYLNKNNVFE